MSAKKAIRTKERYINREQYLALEGLRVLADRNLEHMDRLEDAVAEIIGEVRDENGYYSQTSDFIFSSGSSVHHLLKNTGNKVNYSKKKSK